MSKVLQSQSYLFHTDIGAAVITVSTTSDYDVEDIIRERAVSQARVIQFMNQAAKSSPNDPRGARTLDSVYTTSGEELPA